MEIKGTNVLITGANRGIGRAVAEMCAENRAHVILATRKVDPELIKHLEEKGAASVIQKTLDLSSMNSIEQFLQTNKELRVDILFNNAGQLEGGLLEEQKIEDIYQMLQVNLCGLIHLTHGILPRMLKRKKGKIINNSSVSGIMHFPTASTYGASKAGVIAFTNSLAQELKGTGVSTLLLITPGVDTGMYADIPKKHGQHMRLGNLTPLAPKVYAERIREAILEDLQILRPSGPTALALWAAEHTRGLFQKGVQTRFHR